MVYAPIMDVRSGRVHHVSASTPLLEPFQSFDPWGAPPAAVAPDALLERSIRDVAAFNRVPRNVRLSLSLELSAHLLSDRSLPRRLSSILGEHKMEAGLLTVGVTQEALPDNTVRADSICARVRSTGSRLALLGFDAEHTSPARLANFPIDSVHLDGSFLATVDSDAKRLRCVRRLLQLADGMGISVVAEGVERLSQYELLQSLGCRFAMGSLVGPGAPLSRAVATSPVGAPRTRIAA